MPVEAQVIRTERLDLLPLRVQHAGQRRDRVGRRDPVAGKGIREIRWELSLER
jgi:hypothetical protein